MEWLAETSAFDVLVLAIFLAFLARGIWIGFIRQISSLLAMLGGFLLAGYFDNEFYRLILPYFNDSHTAFLITYILLFIAFFFLIKLVGLGLTKVMDITLSTWFDRAVGGLFGIIKGIFITSLIFVVITSYLSGSNKYLNKSITYPFLKQSSKVILAFIRDHDLRSYFIPKEPAIKLPFFDKLPDDAAQPEK
ncbi:MAG: CvpA family protein [Desulfobulbaceae bacterium]|nr:CvpA family protein [Desulfobulbaceae bacterium]